MTRSAALLDLIDAPTDMWVAAETVRARLAHLTNTILRLEADITATKRVADALATERDDYKTRLAAVTLDLQATRLKTPKSASPLVTHPGVIVDIAAILELEPHVVCQLVTDHHVASVHSTIAERARKMWHDATTPTQTKDAA